MARMNLKQNDKFSVKTLHILVLMQHQQDLSGKKLTKN